MSVSVREPEKLRRQIMPPKKEHLPQTLCEAALLATGLTPFHKQDVESYKKKKAWEASSFVGRHLWLRFVVDACSILNAFLIATLVLTAAFSLAGAVLNINIFGYTVSQILDIMIVSFFVFVINVCIGGIVMHKNKSSGGTFNTSIKAYWHRTPFDQYRARNIPEYAKQTKLDIQTACLDYNLPQPQFFVDWLDLRTYRCPFLLTVDEKGNEEYWEVWDEKFPRNARQ